MGHLGRGDAGELRRNRGIRRCLVPDLRWRLHWRLTRPRHVLLEATVAKGALHAHRALRRWRGRHSWTHHTRTPLHWLELVLVLLLVLHVLHLLHLRRHRALERHRSVGRGRPLHRSLRWEGLARVPVRAEPSFIATVLHMHRMRWLP